MLRATHLAHNCLAGRTVAGARAPHLRRCGYSSFDACRNISYRRIWRALLCCSDAAIALPRKRENATTDVAADSTRRFSITWQLWTLNGGISRLSVAEPTCSTSSILPYVALWTGRCAAPRHNATPIMDAIANDVFYAFSFNAVTRHFAAAGAL